MLGEGVYTISEVAKYTGVPDSTLRSWFEPRADGRGYGPIFRSQWGRVENDFAVSFINLIEAYVASFFRKHDCPSKYIRTVHIILKEKWGIPHPFATQDLRADPPPELVPKDGVEPKRRRRGKIVLIRKDDDALIDPVKNQLVLNTARKHLVEVEYDASGLAKQWNIAEGITINPKVNFGKPVVAKTGVSTLIVAHQYLANHRNAAMVGRLFRIPEDGVVKAFQFEKGLGRIAA